jgi:hypothetical protein
MGSTTKFLSGARKRVGDQSIQLDAIWRSLWPGLGMLAAGVASIGMVASENPIWLVGLVFTPLALGGMKKRAIRFELSQRVLWIDKRAVPFDEIRDLTLVAESTHGPSLLTVNGEALTWVQSTYDNKNLEQELRVALARAA